MKHHVISARTEFANDELSDRRAKVWHLVTVVFYSSVADDGFEGKETVVVRCYSGDPGTAISEVSGMSTADVLKMTAVRGRT